MKQKPVVPRAIARPDIERAIDYYLEQQAGKAALGLIDALQHAYSHIGRHPEAGSSRYAHELDLPGLRSWPLKRYPYLVFYVEQSGHIDIWRVLHSMNDLPAWLRSDSA